MRPLPALADLAPAQPVYNSATDSLVSLLGSDSANISALLGGAQTDESAAAGGLSAASGSLDQIDSIIADTWNVFDSLSTDLNSVDLTGDISTYTILDSSLVGSLDSWAPDLGSAVVSFLGELFPTLTTWLSPVFTYLWDWIAYIFHALITLTTYVTDFYLVAAPIAIGAGGFYGG